MGKGKLKFTIKTKNYNPKKAEHTDVVNTESGE